MYTNIYNSWAKTVTKDPKMSAILYTRLKLFLMELCIYTFIKGKLDTNPNKMKRTPQNGGNPCYKKFFKKFAFALHKLEQLPSVESTSHHIP